MFNQPTWWSVRSPKSRSPKSPKLLVTVVGLWLEAALPWNGCSEATRMKIQYAAKGWATLEFHLSQGQNMSYNLPPAVVVDHSIVKETLQIFNFLTFFRIVPIYVPIFSVSEAVRGWEVTLHQEAEAVTMLDPTAVAASWSRRPLLPLLPGSHSIRSGWKSLEHIDLYRLYLTWRWIHRSPISMSIWSYMIL